MSVLDSCPICHINKPKYKCPACETRSCSLDCSKKHKELYSCTGQIDPTKYVNKSEFSSSLFDRDYNFLQRVGRSVQVGKSDVFDKGLKKKTVRRNTPNETVKNGVNVKLLPIGMRRKILNKSGFNQKKKQYYWTIEWIAYTQDSQTGKWEKKTEIIRNAMDSFSLESLIQRYKFTESSESNYWVYLKKIDCPANNQKLIPLDHTQTLNHALSGKTVIEFPTIYVFYHNGNFDREDRILPSNMYEDEEDSADSSSEDSSSSDSDDDSDRNESPPEETSSKQHDEIPTNPPPVMNE